MGQCAFVPKLSGLGRLVDAGRWKLASMLESQPQFAKNSDWTKQDGNDWE